MTQGCQQIKLSRIMALGYDEIQQAAERMLADYDAGRANELFAERGTAWLSLSDAYQVQRTVAELRIQRGERCLGYKIGCISPTIQKQFGLNEPVRGYVWNGEMLSSATHLSVGPWRPEGRRFVNLAIEGEIAVRMGRSVALPVSDSELANCIECWFPVIELHNYVFRGPTPTSQELVAGNAMHAGTVVPNASEIRSGRLPDQVEIRIEIDGEVVEAKMASEVPGGPLGSMRWVASSLALRHEELRAHDIVLTGSPGRLILVSPDSHIVVMAEPYRVELFLEETNG